MPLPPLTDGAVHESCTPFPLAGAAVRFVGAPGVLAETTLTEALPWIWPTEAVTEPLPAVVPAVKVVLVPVEGETVPREGGLTDQAAVETSTGLPYGSAPLALKPCVPRVATVAELGDTVILARAAALTVSVCVPLDAPLALAVSVGLPALVSS